MFILGLALLLAIVSIASFPCWNHSKRWGHVPCTTAGILLVFVAMIAAGGKPAPGDQVEARIASAPPIASTLAPTDGYILDTSKQPIPLSRHASGAVAQTSSQ